MHHLIKGAEIKVTEINSTCIFEIHVNYFHEVLIFYNKVSQLIYTHMW